MVTPELSRCGFLGAGLALVASPAVVRAESLMRIVVPPDWRSFVREIRQYDVIDDEYFVRWDVLARGQLLHVTARAYAESFVPEGLPHLRAPAIECLGNELAMRNVSPYELRHLEPPANAVRPKRGIR